MEHVTNNWNARQRRAYVRQNGGYLKVLTGLTTEDIKDGLGVIAIFGMALLLVFGSVL